MNFFEQLKDFDDVIQNENFVDNLLYMQNQ